MTSWELLATALEPQLIPGLLAAAIFVLGVGAIYVLPKYKWFAAAILLAVITPLALPGFWFSSADLGISDWDLYYTYYHHLHRTITGFHQFPLWNPWMCGGSAALGDPEFPVFSPTFLNVLAFGVERGLKLTIYAATAIGAVGMLMLGKRLKLSVSAALLAAIGVAFSTVNLLEVVEGHPNIFSAMWIPWIFWSWLGAYRAVPSLSPTNFDDLARGAGLNNVKIRMKIWSQNLVGLKLQTILCGIFLALAFFQGGIYMLSYTTLAFLVLLVLAPNHKRAFLITLKSGLWALGFAAMKLIPTALWLSEFQDESYASSTYTLPYLHKIFFGRYLHGAGEPAGIIPNQGSGWHEYGAYIGPFVAALALIGLTKLRKNRVVRALLTAAVLAILLSSSGPLLKPVFDQVPFIPRSNVSRIILFAVIPISLLAGYGLDSLRENMSRKWLAALVVIACLGIVSGDLFTLAAQLSSQALVLPYPEIPIPPAPNPIAHTSHTYEIRHHGTDYTRTYAAAVKGYGTAAACNVLRPKNTVRTIHDKENFGPVLHSNQLSVLQTDWSPNKITTAVRAIRLPTVPLAEAMLNTNYADGWWVIVSGEDAPKPAQNIQGRVGTHLNPGDYTLTFYYRPRGLWVGLAVTALTILGALTLVFARRYRASRNVSISSSSPTRKPDF